jgi:GNAT superfamily N-acetyltransferase
VSPPLPRPGSPVPPPAYRPARATDLDACTRVWQVAIDDYQSRLNQPALPADLGHLRRLLAHLLDTDPDRFWVAEAGPGVGLDRVPLPIGFAAASLREGLWFLAMLFVEPAFQAAGIGSALLDRALAARDVVPGGPLVPGPDDALDSGIHTWGMCTDSAQPISNALYAARGMPPRVPVWRAVGEVRRWSALPLPPARCQALPFERIEAEGADGPRRLAGLLDELDRELIGSAHPVDHRYARRDGRSGFLLREHGGRVLGYAYGSGSGRLGPVAAVDPALHPVLLGVAIREVPVPGPVAAWVPGTADRALRAVLDAGLRLESFPAIVCWSREDHPFARYLPISLALV